MTERIPPHDTFHGLEPYYPKLDGTDVIFYDASSQWQEASKKPQPIDNTQLIKEKKPSDDKTNQTGGKGTPKSSM